MCLYVCKLWWCFAWFFDSGDFCLSLGTSFEPTRRLSFCSFWNVLILCFYLCVGPGTGRLPTKADFWLFGDTERRWKSWSLKKVVTGRLVFPNGLTTTIDDRPTDRPTTAIEASSSPTPVNSTALCLDSDSGALAKPRTHQLIKDEPAAVFCCAKTGPPTVRDLLLNERVCRWAARSRVWQTPNLIPSEVR